MSTPTVHRTARSKKPLPGAPRTATLATLAAPFIAATVLDEAWTRLIDVVAPRYDERRPGVLLALAMVLEAEARGHTALDFDRIEDLLPPRSEPAPEKRRPVEDPRPVDDGVAAGGLDETVDEAEERTDEIDEAVEPPTTVLDWKPVRDGAAMLATSKLVGGPDDATTPFVGLGGDTTLFLSRRFFHAQREVARRLVGLAKAAPVNPVAGAAVEDFVTTLLAAKDHGAQAVLAMRCFLDGGRVTVITGGPGTGKTFSIARTLAAMFLDAAAKGLPVPRVAMAAPTGKAAVRMREALAEAVNKAPAVPAAAKLELAKVSQLTVHKLLGIRPTTGKPRHDADTPLPYDVVVVDEASMLDVALMDKLLAAIGPSTRLVLLGDRDQLASVDAGTVLADVVAGRFAERDDALAKRVIFFETTHRFSDDSPMGIFARNVRTPAKVESSQDVRARLAVAEEVLCRGELGQAVPDDPRLAATVLDDLAKPYIDGYVKLLAVPDRTTLNVPEVLKELDRYRVLCTHRRGPRGVAGLNRAIDERVRKALRASGRETGGRELPVRARCWVGLPVLVTENAYDLDLRNGDVGLVLPGPNHTLDACFLRAGDAPDSPRVQRVRVERLPPWMPAFAMTVHKGQGSQYANVALVLAGRDSPLETRELIYTGITRAQIGARWIGSREALHRGLARPVGRASALQRILDAELAQTPLRGVGASYEALAP